MSTRQFDPTRLNPWLDPSHVQLSVSAVASRRRTAAHESEFDVCFLSAGAQYTCVRLVYTGKLQQQQQQ